MLWQCEICFVVFACLGFLSPANRGALMTCTLVLYVCLGTPAGYVSARVYKSKARQVFFAGKIFPLEKEKTIVCWKLIRIYSFYVALDKLDTVRFHIKLDIILRILHLWFYVIEPTKVKTVLRFFFWGICVSVNCLVLSNVQHNLWFPITVFGGEKWKSNVIFTAFLCPG